MKPRTHHNIIVEPTVKLAYTDSVFVDIVSLIMVALSNKRLAGGVGSCLIPVANYSSKYMLGLCIR